MTGPAITPMLRGGRFRVTCSEHQLDRTVDTESHANNLLALHLRRDHPLPADDAAVAHLSDAAAYVAVLHDDHLTSSDARDAVLRTWALLLGKTDLDEALAYARRIAPADLLAFTTPF